MATAREHFALDWIKADLLETLNDARIALDEYAELGKEETRMRACLTGLHQVHGTLVMLELAGVSQLADHLEQLAQAMLGQQVDDEAAAGQALMQGILELPGYLDEIQRGAEDNVSTSMPLVNEIRTILGQEALVDPAGASLREGASDEVIARFHAIGGPEKVARIRSAYQNVLLSILKGEDRSAAVGTLGKIALGLGKVTEGAPLARQWQAFEEFVNSLKQHSGALESEAVKLLRRVDLEIKTLAKDGEAALRQPVNMELVQQLLEGAVERDNRSDAVIGLQEAVARDVSNNTLAISGRQALGSAAQALQEDLSYIKDKLDILVRADVVDLEELRTLTSPLKQVGSTLSLLGFESSREIISDQVDAIENLVVLGDGDPQGVASIAGALIQIDENLSSVILGGGQSEVEQITTDAQLQVLREARKDLDVVKQCIVDFVTAHWSIGHLESVPGKLTEIRGALGIIPLTRAIEMLGGVGQYIESRLMQGHRPEWQELDQFADVISALDYYLERLADETSSGAEDILVVAQRSLAELQLEVTPAAAAAEVDEVAVAPVFSADNDEALSAAVDSVVEDVEQEAGITAASADVPEAATTEALSGQDASGSATAEELVEMAASADNDAIEIAAPGAAEVVDTENLPSLEEPKLAMEEDAGFDLSGDTFANIEGAVENTAIADAGEPEIDVEKLAAQAQQVEQAEQAEAELPQDDVAQVAAPVDMPDPEIVEIFIEEVDEVLETIHEYLPLWAQDFAHIDALTEVRRAFHTLKGSGRIVQAAAIGEMAWGIENMLNRVIENTVTPNPQFVAAIEAACELVPSLRTAYANGEVGDLDRVSLIIEQADVLASGGEIDTAVFAALPAAVETTEVADAQARPEEVTEQPVEDAALEIESVEAADIVEAADSDDEFDPESLALEPLAEDAADEIAEALFGDAGEDVSEPVIEAPDIEAPDLTLEPLEPAAEDIEESIDFVTEPNDGLIDNAADEVPADLEPVYDMHADAVSEETQDAAEEHAVQEYVVQEDAAEEAAEEESTLDLFLSEALEHLAIMQEENAKEPWRLSDPIARAFHTLTGIAGLAEIDQVRLIVEPAYQVVESFRNAPATEELRAFFLQAQSHLIECVDSLQTGKTWEEPLEFVAAADDLLATQGQAPRAVDVLLDAPVTAAVFEHEEEFLAYLSAADRGEEHTGVGGLQSTLSELANLAADMQAQPLADLSLALQAKLAAAQGMDRLPSGASTVLRAGYHQLIDQLNEIAAGSDVVPQHELIAALQALDMRAPETKPEAEEVAAEQTEAADSDDQAELAELAEVDADLVEVFFEEAEEICEELEASIMSWSSERDNRIYMENMLRGLHTLKGGARLCGLAKLGDMAHDFESMVIEVQTNERPIDDALFSALHGRYDEIVNRLNTVTRAVSDSLPTAAAAAEVPVVEAPQPVAPVEVTADVVAEHVETADDNAADNVVDLPTSETGAADAEPPAAPLVSDVNKIVEAVVAPTTPALPKAPAPKAPEKAETPATGSHEMVRVGSALLEELVNLAGESSILRARIEQGMSDFTGALDEMETTIERLREQLRRLEIETETQILHRHERNDGPQYENFDPLEMDRYNQLQQLSRSLSESASDMLDLKETLLFKARESETLLLQQARINTELQEGLMRTRMVPFSRLMPRLRRIVRQVSSELGKEVEFHVQNAEGELDRNLLERMVPPLEHMLRNAVDHGIEDEELRRNYGKPAGGRIDLRLTREGGDVVIEISDDGAGIDVETVRAKAIERGLMAADADLADEEVLQFVLAAGFSTAKSVTQISGRGVGLDVVASEVKQLGGSVSILSAPGKGTRFVVRVPFTVSVNRALMVSVADDLYALPLNTIEGIVLLSPDQLQALYSSESKTFEYAGIPYRVRYLGQYLGREYRGAANASASVPMVLVRSGDHAVAIHVDLVQGSREIVVKSLGPQFAGVGGISGATILGDGSVVVILDLLALIRAQQFERQRKNPNQARRSGPRCVMVVDDSVTVRKVTSRLLERQGMDVLVAKDGVEAVAMLQERRPDIMLLDIEMPRMDGFEVARQVRHDDRLGDLPIVMISSRTGDKHKEHANQLGVNKFLGKPFQENELLATIDELVTRS